MTVSTLFKSPIFKGSNTCVNVLTVIPCKINLKSRSNRANLQWHGKYIAITKVKREFRVRKYCTKRATNAGRENFKFYISMSDVKVFFRFQNFLALLTATHFPPLDWFHTLLSVLIIGYLLALAYRTSFYF